MFLVHGGLALFVIFLLSGLAICENLFPLLSHDQVPANIKSRINRKSVQSSEDIDSSSRPADIVIPIPEPSQTFGDWIDDVDALLNETSDDDTHGSKITTTPELSARDFIRESDYRRSVWSNGPEQYNVSVSSCIRFSDTIGKWTTKDGTTVPEATLTNITLDLDGNAHFHNRTELSDHLKTRILTNAELLESEAEAALQSSICGYGNASPPDSSSPPSSFISSSAPAASHDELRKLLTPKAGLEHLNTKFMAMDGYWTASLAAMAAGSTVSGSLYKGFYNHNATSKSVALVCFSAAVLIFAHAVRERLYMTGHFAFMESSVVAAFLAWARQAIELAVSLQQAFLQQVGADRTTSGGTVCLEEIVVENGLQGLSGYSEPGAHIELVPLGRC